MTTPFIGEIRYFPYNRGAPSGWLACQGQLLPISQYDTLFSLLSTTYGGDGQSTFALPNLSGRVAVGTGTSSTGTGYPLGSTGGSETVTLQPAEMPLHSHAMQASTAAATATGPGGQVYAATPQGVAPYTTGSDTAVAMASGMVSRVGQNQPHENCAPTCAIFACIAYEGIYPSQN